MSKEYLIYVQKSEAEKVLAAENAKQGFPKKDCFTLNAFSIIQEKTGVEFLIQKDNVTHNYDQTKCIESEIEIKEKIIIPNGIK